MKSLCLVFLLVALPVSAQDIEIDESCWLLLVDSLQFQFGWTAPPWCYGGHPAVRDIWGALEQTPAIDSDRYDVGGEESLSQALILTRGSSPSGNQWFYENLEVTDPAAAGSTGTYFDFNSLEELEIVTAAAPIGVQSGGAVVLISTRDSGTLWHGNASIFGTNDSLQAENTPEEFIPIKTSESIGMDKYLEYGVDAGGSIISEQLFVWGAAQRVEVDRNVNFEVTEQTKLTSITTKLQWDPSTSHMLEFEYFRSDKTSHQRLDTPAQVAPEVTRDQHGTDTILPGIWRSEYNWIPNEHSIFNVQYGYVGSGFSLVPAGGTDKPVIYFPMINRYESTFITNDPVDRPSQQITASATHFRDVLGADHEFRFGFDYRRTSIDSLSSYGNGMFIVDSGQTTPGGPLTYGYLYLQRPIYSRAEMNRTSFHMEDSIRWKRLALQLGFRFDHQSGNSLPTNLPGIPGFEDIVFPVELEGTPTDVTFNNLAPRLRASFDVTDDGKTLLQAGYSRYYDPILVSAVNHGNPAAHSSGAILGYTELHGDRTVTRDEVTSDPYFFGDFCHGLDDRFCPSKTYDPDLQNTYANELFVKLERELPYDTVVSAGYIHRSYEDFYASLPENVDSDDFVQSGALVLNTTLGSFEVPIYDPTFYSNHEILSNISGYSQEYNGFDLTVRKRAGKYVGLSGGLVIQRQKSNYESQDGLAYSVDDGQLQGSVLPFDPTNAPFLEGQAYGYSQSGVYPFSEWQLKMAGTAYLPAGMELGAFARYQQGYPYVLFARVPSCSFECTPDRLILVEPFGSRRYDNLFSLDLQIQKRFDIRYGDLTVQMDINNVTNENTVTERQRLVTSVNLNSPINYISPRIFRFGLRYSF